MQRMAAVWRARAWHAVRMRAHASRSASTWSDVVSTAKEALSSEHAAASMTRDPLEVVGKDLSSLRHNIAALLGSGHPSLDRIAKYYFSAEGKHVRPMIVLLMSKATNGLSATWQAQRAAAVGEYVDMPMARGDILNDANPSATQPHEPRTTAPAPVSGAAYVPHLSDTILPTQQRLAEITEMIHVASLLHDDVIDASPLRRGTTSAPSAFGNKLSILGGDFLLGRASIALARLRDPEVTELMSTVIANLVEGEVMQLKSTASGQVPVTDVQSACPSNDVMCDHWAAYDVQPDIGPSATLFAFYMQKTYLKTASLIAKSARSATVLGGCGTWSNQLYANLSHAEQTEASAVCDAAYTFGRNVGIAFQLVDDLLDFHATTEAFGKPSGGADLKLGLATAPVLYAWQQYPDSPLGTLVQRRFGEPGDVEQALELVHKSDGLQRTAKLARYHADAAQRALHALPQSDARAALEKLNHQIITRAK